MNINANNLGFAELYLIADFIREIENGNPIITDMLDEGNDITISFDLHYNAVTVENESQMFYYPDDFE